MIKTSKILIGLAFIFFINSCVEDDDYTIPNLTIAPVNIDILGAYKSFSNLVELHDDLVDVNDDGYISPQEKENAENVVAVISFEKELDLYTFGYVVSDDGSGNFFEEIIVQNSVNENDPPNDIRRGLKININDRDLGGFYNFGRKVYIKLNGLAIGYKNGVYVIGKSKGNDVVQLQNSSLEFGYKNVILRDPETTVITPKIVSISDLQESDENTFIKLVNSQITKSQKNKTYAANSNDIFDGFRTIESCDTNGVIILQTSTFADFKGAQLSQGRGAISGVYSRDFRDDFNVLILNSLSEVQFNDSNRCDPIVLECNLINDSGTVFFSENFENFSNYIEENWTMININEGGVDWFISNFSGNNYSRISAFGSNETEAEVWLITPNINMDISIEEELNFDIQVSFDNGTILSVFVSENFMGDVVTATWTQIDAAIPSGPSGAFGKFETVGPLNVSCVNGTVNFAFVYSGSDPSASTRYHIDNIELKGN